MKKSTRLTIIFAGVAVLIVLFFILTSRGKNPEDTAAAPVIERIQITDMEEGSISKIELVRGEKILQLVSNNGEWGVEPNPPFTLLPGAVEAIDRNIRNLTAEQIVEESTDTPESFGFTSPLATIRASLVNGSNLVLYLGDPTPSKQSFYLQKEGDPRVYTIRASSAKPFFYALNDLRPNRLTHVDISRLTYVYIKNNGREMEIVPIDRERFKLAAPFSAFLMTRPWLKPRGTDAEKMDAFLQAIPFSFQIEDFAADNPADLSVYGLKPPSAEVILKDHANTLHLLTGEKDENGNIYAMESGSTSVVTLPEESLVLLDTTPFTLMDKFALIVNIDFVDQVIFSSQDGLFKAEIVRKPGAGEDGEWEYMIDGEKIKEQTFKKYYQKLIGLLLEAEHPAPGESTAGKTPVITIRYDLNIPEKYAEVSFFDFNRNFFAASIESGAPSDTPSRGGIEFLISRDQVNKAVQEAMELVNADKNL